MLRPGRMRLYAELPHDLGLVLASSRGEMKACIVIPAYNAKTTVGLAVSAALAQHNESRKLVVVDDGSTDGTSEIIKTYPGVKYIRQDNAGPAKARNTG
jgi:glycosyltransferase involved in cell wall biosynthesis